MGDELARYTKIMEALGWEPFDKRYLIMFSNEGVISGVEDSRQ